MPNVMVALPNIGGALCSTPQSLARAHCSIAVQQGCKQDLSKRDRDESDRDIRFLVRDEIETKTFLISATRRDLARPRPRRFSRPSTFHIVRRQWMATFKLKLFIKNSTGQRRSLSLTHLHCN